jgi:hypothetical protein
MPDPDEVSPVQQADNIRARYLVGQLDQQCAVECLRAVLDVTDQGAIDLLDDYRLVAEHYNPELPVSDATGRRRLLLNPITLTATLALWALIGLGIWWWLS